MTSQEIDQLIYNTAIQQGFTPVAAKFVVAQARFESADYTSNVFKVNNNTSGIKFVGQSNATRGTLSPEGNYYARFNTIQDSINDKIVRIYNINMGGVSPEQLKSSQTVDEFARLLKMRRYYGPSAYGTSGAEKEISQYAGGMKAKLLKIKVLEFIEKNSTLLVAGLLLLIGGSYFLYQKLKK